VTRRTAVAVLLGMLLMAVGCDGGESITTSTDTSPSTSTSPSTASSTTTTTTTTTVPTTSTTLDWRLPTVHDDPGPGWMVTADGVWVSEPTVREAGWYAEVAGITVEEAERRNGLVGELGGYLPWLERRSWSGGLWVEETADAWRVVVTTTDLAKAERLVSRRLEGAVVLGSVVFREVEDTVSDLKGRLRRLEEEVEDWCLPPLTLLQIDLIGNRAVVGVEDLGEFTAAAGFVGARLDGVTLVEHLVSPLPVGATGCGVLAEEVAAARVRWESHELEGYAFTASRSSQVPTDPWEVRVWRGEVTEVPLPEPGEDPYPLPNRFGTRFGTVDHLLDLIESTPSAWISAEFDPAWGYPTRISLNEPHWIDEEWTLTIEDFRVLDEPPDPPPSLPDTVVEGRLQMERNFPNYPVIVEAVVGSPLRVDRHFLGWVYSIEVEQIIYHPDHLDPLPLGTVEVSDRMFSPPGNLLPHGGQRVLLLLTLDWFDQRPSWAVFAVAQRTDNGLRLSGSMAQYAGFDTEVAYLCHYPRSSIPLDGTPDRDADAELDLLIRWLEEIPHPYPDGGGYQPKYDALQRACEAS